MSPEFFIKFLLFIFFNTVLNLGMFFLNLYCSLKKIVKKFSLYFLFIKYINILKLKAEVVYERKQGWKVTPLKLKIISFLEENLINSIYVFNSRWCDYKGNHCSLDMLKTKSKFKNAISVYKKLDYWFPVIYNISFYIFYLFNFLVFCFIFFFKTCFKYTLFFSDLFNAVFKLIFNNVLILVISILKTISKLFYFIWEVIQYFFIKLYILCTTAEPYLEEDPEKEIDVKQIKIFVKKLYYFCFDFVFFFFKAFFDVFTAFFYSSFTSKSIIQGLKDSFKVLCEYFPSLKRFFF